MRLLLIRPGALGDTLLTFPVIEALRADTPDPHIMLVGNKAVLPLALAFGLVEEVFNYEDPLWSGLFATPSSNSRTDNVQKERNRSLYNILSGTDRVVAWLSDPDKIVYQNLQAAGIPHVTVISGRPPVQERIHIVDYFARSVGVSTNPYPRYGDCSSVTGDSIPGQGRAFAIHPGSGGARKCWPPERFAAVIRRLWQQGWPVLLLSGPADHERLEALFKLLPAPPQPSLLKLLVDVPLLDLVPVLCQCRGYLGNDAGMTHLAALLGLPTLVLFGPTDPQIWQPHGRAVNVILVPNLEQLGIDRVIEYIENMEL